MEINIFQIICIIIVLFFIFLIIKAYLKKYKDKICVICIAVSLTWIILLLLNYLDLFKNKIIIALLMGQTILGVYYLIEGMIKEELKLFRLPFLLTLTFLGFSMIKTPDSVILFRSTLLLIILWILFAVVYQYRFNNRVKLFVDKMIDCCKKI